MPGRPHLGWARLATLTAAAAALVALALPVAAGAATTRVVYVSNGLFTGSQNVSALRINPNGSLTQLPGSPYGTMGGNPVTEGIAITPDAENVYVARFGTSQVSRFAVGANGGLSNMQNFSTGFVTPLGVAPRPDGRHLFAWNHGNAIAVSSIGANGGLTNIAGSPFTVQAPATNPFAGSVSPDGDHLYVPNENNNPSSAPETVTAYAVAAGGAVSPIQPNIASGNPANMSNPFGSAITPDGRFFYVSNPEDGPNGTISGFLVNNNGTLSTIDVSPGIAGVWRNAAPGNHPLAMVVSPDGRYLYVATRASNTVNAYRIGVAGSLTPLAGQPYATGGQNGKALALTPDGRRLYVANQVSNNISGFNVAANGTLSLISGSPWPTGGTDPDLESIVITPNQAPRANFSVQEGLAGQVPTRFNGNFSFDTDGGTIGRYSWDYGDGVQQTNGGPTPEHTYAQPGLYTVTLRVFDDEGCSTDRIFTGKATLCNASPLAQESAQVRIRAPKCAGRRSTIIGTSGLDTLNGTNGSDVISGLGARDVIRGRGGRDFICAGQGRDRVNGGAGNDRIRGGPGPDRLFGNGGRDRINGGARRDRLFGNRGDDVLFGGPGRDLLFGGAGRDVEIQ